MAKTQMISRTRWIEAKHLIKFLLQIAFSSTVVIDEIKAVFSLLALFNLSCRD